MRRGADSVQEKRPAIIGVDLDTFEFAIGQGSHIGEQACRIFVEVQEGLGLSVEDAPGSAP